MVKAPVAGRVKTRLARAIGTTQATRFYRATASAVIARLGCDRRWRCWLSVAPQTEIAGRWWPAHLRRFGQGAGDLGARMQRPLDILPPGPVVIVGTDIPAIRAADIAEAFRRLGGTDAVFGPAADGGFWLVGLRRTPRVLAPFADVGWSRPTTLAETRANLAGHRIAEAAALSDVDSARDLATVAGWTGRRVLPLGAGR